MVLDCRVEYLIEKLGHDGSEILWPNLHEPFRRRGHHIEEIQYVALGFGTVFAPFVPAFEYNPEASPCLDFVQYRFTVEYNCILTLFDGILVGHWTPGRPHAVAWNAKERAIYDPEGKVYDQTGAFVPETLFAAIKRA